MTRVLEAWSSSHAAAAACDSGSRAGSPEPAGPAGPHPLTIALLTSILLALAVLAARRPRAMIAAGAGQTVAAVAGVVSAVTIRGATTGGAVRFTGREGTPDLAAAWRTFLRKRGHGRRLGRRGSRSATGGARPPSDRP